MFNGKKRNGTPYTPPASVLEIVAGDPLLLGERVKDVARHVCTAHSLDGVIVLAWKGTIVDVGGAGPGMDNDRIKDIVIAVGDGYRKERGERTP